MIADDRGIVHSEYKMQYTLLFFSSPEGFASRSTPEGRAEFYTTFGPYMDAIHEAGIVKGGFGLMPPETATTIRRVGDERRVQDGPCPDTKEQLAGLFVIEVPDLDAAMEWANRYPGESVEVRPNIPPLQ